MSSSKIFIMGHERSGTSLLRALLGSHPEIVIPPNDYNIWEIIDRREGFGDLSKKENRVKVYRFLENNPNKLQKWGISWDQLKEDILNNASKSLDIPQLILENYWRKFDCKIKGFKKPYTEFRKDLLEKIFPESLFIGIIRDGRSVVASHKYWNGVSLAWRIPLKERVITTSLSWKSSIKKIRKLKKEEPNQIFILKYEDMVKSPETISKKLCKFIDIPFREKMLNIDEEWGWNSNTSFSKSKDNSIIYKDSLQRWKDRLSDLEIKIIENLIGDTLLDEGYQLTSLDKDHKTKIIYNLSRLFSWPISKLRQLISNLKRYISSSRFLIDYRSRNKD